MDRQTVISKIHQICGRRTVIISEKFGYYDHLPDDNQPGTDYTVSIMPGLNGSDCSIYNGGNLQECMEGFAYAVTSILESK